LLTAPATSAPLPFLIPSSPAQIDLIWGQWHNLPSLPSPIRNINGMFMGALPHMMEPVWGRTMEFVGDDFYKKKVTGWGCDELIASKCVAAWVLACVCLCIRARMCVLA
jgi:hypothetical protein